MTTSKDEPQEQVEETIPDDIPDLGVSGEDAESVKGGMTKQEFIQRTSNKSGLSA